ncbi:hypothetical protein F5148DRAFT_553211 [Russula earlei]|uniref:Uncharacterized protein n=1 Tax=Russula earlei TaxID=71964 RepID=A0ACC0TX15_9AGAM|nr:hypothetical protein F5148DRAFT_553211 [Russula earlei]
MATHHVSTVCLIFFTDIIRLLLMVPIYASISLASYLFWDIATPLLLICDAYEAVLTSHDAPSSPHATSAVAQEDQGLGPEPSNAAPPKDQTPPPRRRHRRSCRHKHHTAPCHLFHRIPVHMYALVHMC